MPTDASGTDDPQETDHPPVVSIITPTYNRSGWISRTIDSVIKQTFEDFEMIVVDDGSTDQTPEVIDRYTDNEDRLRYIRFEENQGANAARNAGIRAARGEFISFLDSDDVLYPRNLEVTTTALRNAPPDCMGVFTSYRHLKGDQVVNVSRVRERSVSSEDAWSNPVGMFSAAMFRAEVFDEVGLPDEDFVSHQDLEFFTRVLREYTMLGVAETLCDYHEDGESISSNPERRLEGQQQFLQKHGGDLSQRALGRLRYGSGFQYVNLGDLPAARRELLQAIRHDPRRLRYYYHFVAALLGRRVFKRSIALKRRGYLLVSSVRRMVS